VDSGVVARPGVGEAVLFKGGTLEHEGAEVTGGVRYIVVGFVWKGGKWGEREREAVRKMWEGEGGGGGGEEGGGGGFSFGFDC
jgi:hypothetical protein